LAARSVSTARRLWWTKLCRGRDMTVVIITATIPAKAMTMMSSTRVKPDWG